VRPEEAEQALAMRLEWDYDVVENEERWTSIEHHKQTSHFEIGLDVEGRKGARSYHARRL
jgi:hypothetical protein